MILSPISSNAVKTNSRILYWLSLPLRLPLHQLRIPEGLNKPKGGPPNFQSKACKKCHRLAWPLERGGNCQQHYSFARSGKHTLSQYLPKSLLPTGSMPRLVQMPILSRPTTTSFFPIPKITSKVWLLSFSKSGI